MSNSSSLVKKVFKSKTLVTKCGYCNNQVKEENLEKHCRVVHKKTKLVAGQKTLDGLFRRSSQISWQEDEPPEEPPLKQLKLSNIEDNDEQIVRKCDFDNNNSKVEAARDESDSYDKLESYSQLDSFESSTSPPPPTQLSHPPPVQPRQAQSLSALSNEWMALLQSGKASDMTILCKEEVEVTCHSLVLTVRCPIMLENVVREGSGQMFIVMDQYEHTVVKVLLQFLYGGVLNTEEISEREQLVQLRKMVAKFKMKKLDLLLSDLNAEDDDEEIVEEYSSDKVADNNFESSNTAVETMCDQVVAPDPPSISETNNNLVTAAVPTSKLDEIVTKIDALKASVDTLQNKSLPEFAKPTDVLPDSDHIEQLVMCKTVEDILTCYAELSYVEEEEVLKCDLCCSKPRMGGSIPGLFRYKKNTNESSQKQSLPFRHLKDHIKNHLKSKVHIDYWEGWKKLEDEENQFKIRCREVGIRIARLCYDIYKEGKSLRSFEKEVLKAVMNGCDLGNLNHSHSFPDKFRSYVAEEVRKRTISFLSSRLEPTGFLPAVNVQADKGTTVRNTRQFTTVAAVVPGAESLVSIIYLGQPIVTSHSGDGVSCSIVEELKLYSIDSSQVEGGSFDGQYFHLSVPAHLTDKLKLPTQFQCTWDPLHKIGVIETHIRSDAGFVWLVNLTTTCQQLYKKFNWGKNYQALVEKCDLLEMRMRNLKTFSTTRFPNSVRAVFDTLIDDFKPVVKCLEDIIENGENNGLEARNRADEATAILRKVLSKSFVLRLSGTSNIYERFGFIANLCQVVDLLPYERYDNVMNGIEHFDEMIENIDHNECVKQRETNLDDNGKSRVKCYWPRYHSCQEQLELGKFKGIPIKNDHETKAYFTKLRKKKK